MVWFYAKRYGWGWTPVTWQGWALTALYIAAMWPVLLASAVLIAVCWVKGELPRWRWGS